MRDSTSELLLRVEHQSLDRRNGRTLSRRDSGLPRRMRHTHLVTSTSRLGCEVMIVVSCRVQVTREWNRKHFRNGM